MIVDAHTHIGLERIFNVNMPAEELLKVMDKYGIDKAIVQPQVGSPEPKKNHEEVYELTQKFPGKFYGLACINPLQDDKSYFEKAEWAIKELDFRGLKVHTNGFGTSPLNPYVHKVFEAGRKFNVPVMIHTGAGVPQALPSLVIPMAREFEDVPIILAHAGAGLFTGEAIVAAQLCPNIYLETSWVYPGDIIGITKAIGGKRMMFGSDVYENVGPFKAAYDMSGIPQEDYDWAMGKTAEKLFNL